MANYRDPERLENDYQSFVKLVHVLGGAYFWELVCTCGFELDVLRGKRPYRWTIWVYLSIRLNTTAALIVLLIEKDSSGLSHCRTWDTAVYAFCYLSLASASAIIVIRIGAIWSYNRFALGLSVVVWLASSALNIRDLTLGSAASVQRSSDALASGACSSGLMWFALATMAEAPNVILASVNLNGTCLERDVPTDRASYSGDRLNTPVSEPLRVRLHYNLPFVDNLSDADGGTETQSVRFRHISEGTTLCVSVGGAEEVIPMSVRSA
ncbi:hypothetical protein BV25DRAFT_1920471 [Artomyces pyxidatus]|uniref:Uncharacterized protein n=1 Tax=Artomyces pyxidatus TaxID=48021 RepID=A0ACB8SMD1_9AGAM|nr:hypothetical protein BV25DRAFT_1920471 [Artomyces pyxidatus]